ncbi:MAG: methyltransferase domain-containing protein [Actinobacteria bacterium]|nr:methyltransferase domain-containing protein [Actinomycetota bacterium]
MSSVLRAWDGDAYHRLSTPMVDMAIPVLDRLALIDGESVLDAGCGSGRVTAFVVERNPHGRVVAVDADLSMVRAASETLGGTDAVVRQVDLLELDLPALELGVDAVDAVFSTATFHWIKDHDTLFRRLFGALVPGGRMEAQCGGGHNIERVHGVARQVAAKPEYRDALVDIEQVTNFYTPDQTEQRLRDAGFVDLKCWLEDVPVVSDDPVGYLSAIILGQHRERLGEEVGARYVREVADGLGYPGTVTFDYVRLNISARRPA